MGVTSVVLFGPVTRDQLTDASDAPEPSQSTFAPRHRTAT